MAYMLHYLGRHGTHYKPADEFKHRVKPDTAPDGWTRYYRQSYRVRRKLLKWLETFVSGQYAVGAHFILFENEVDAVMYKLKYPR